LDPKIANIFVGKKLENKQIQKLAIIVAETGQQLIG